MTTKTVCSVAGLCVALALAATPLSCGGGGSHSSGTGAGASPTAGIERATGVPWVLTTGSGFAPVSHLFPASPPPPLVTGTTTPTQAAQVFLARYGADLFGMRDPETELVPLASNGPDALGLTWVSLQQVDAGVTVAGRTVQVVFDAAGRIALVWSGYVGAPLDGLAVQPDISSDQARSLAAAAVPGAAATGTPLLGVAVLDAQVALAWQVVVTPTADPLASSWVVTLDAHSGAVVAAEEAVETARPYTGPGNVAPAQASGGLGDLNSFSVFQSMTTPPVNYMQQLFASGASSASWIWVEGWMPGLDPATPELTSVTPTANDMSWKASLPVSPGSDVDAFVHFSAAQTWWASHLGWSSWNGQGGGIAIQLRRAPNGTSDPDLKNLYVDNAAFGGPAPGDPSTGLFIIGFPFMTSTPGVAAAIDVVGHEYTHAVTSASACIGTSYCIDNQTPQFRLPRTTTLGAMNESLADIFGQLLELEVAPTIYAATPAIIGEAAGDGFTRNLKDPHSTQYTGCQQPDGTYAQPDNLRDPLFTSPPPTSTPASQAGTPCTDKYYFAGVPNNAWYLATFGGTNATSAVSVPEADALGPANARDLYGSLLLGARQGTVVSLRDVALVLAELARDKFGDANSASELRAVACAWYAVGALTPDEVVSKFNVHDCGCPADAPDGTFCGGHGIWGSEGSPSSLYTCAGGKLIGIQACPPASGAPACTVKAARGTDACANPPDAGHDGGAGGSGGGGGNWNPICPLSTAEVGAALGISGVTGPVINENVGTDVTTGLIRECEFDVNGGQVLGATFVMGPTGTTPGTATFDTLQSTLSQVGLTIELLDGLGLEAFAAYQSGLPNPAALDVAIDDITNLEIVAPGGSLAAQEELARLWMSRL